MQHIVKVLTGAWAMTDVWAYDILIKATIRAATIITNFIHLQPRECNLLTRYVNWVENTSLSGCSNSRDGDQWKQKGGQYKRTRLWLINDSSGFSNASSLLAVIDSLHPLHFKQCLRICRSGSPFLAKATCSECLGFPGKLEATCELGWTLQPCKSGWNTSTALLVSFHGSPSAGLNSVSKH